MHPAGKEFKRDAKDIVKIVKFIGKKFCKTG
jgi:hypothetical protein